MWISPDPCLSVIFGHFCSSTVQSISIKKCTHGNHQFCKRKSTHRDQRSDESMREIMCVCVWKLYAKCTAWKEWANKPRDHYERGLAHRILDVLNAAWIIINDDSRGRMRISVAHIQHRNLLRSLHNVTPIICCRTPNEQKERRKKNASKYGMYFGWLTCCSMLIYVSEGLHGYFTWQ